ncbi:hypothetical protein LTS18_007161, partial [Coniosporium uncinatum]
MKWDASKDGHANDIRDQPVVSAHAHHPAAPSPTVGARTSSGTKIPSTNHNAANRDKPGFFRRVFGSSKNLSSAPQSQLSASAPSPTPPTLQDNAPPQTPKRSGTERNPQQTAAQLKGDRNSELLPRVSPDMTNDQPRIVQKKSSSFFRRRKKSTVEHTRPPVPTLHLQYGQRENAATVGGQLHPQPSPSMSSLRKVMNPYLTEVDNTTGTYSDPRKQHFSASEVGTGAKRTDGLLQGSDQYRNATVRAFKPESKDANAEGSAPPSWDNDPNGGLQTSSDSPSTKYKLKLRSRRPPHGDDGGEGSFAACTANVTQTTSFIQQYSSHGLISENRSRPRTSPTFLKSTPQLDLGKENRAPQPQTRRANSGEKRLDMLSPISDHSYVHSDTGERGASDYSSPLPDLLDDRWFVSKLQREQSLPRTESRTGRVWIDDDDDDSFEQKLEDLTQLPLPWSEDAVLEKAVSPVSATETNDVFHSATSLPMVRVEGEEISDKPIKEDAAKAIAIEEAEPSADDRRAAEMIYSGDDVYVKRSGAAALLGEASFISARMRRAYMELFDWTGLNMLSAFRNLCQRLIMKAESQALDRVIDAFSKRWCECNETHGFKASDVVHTITFSILMLNTDLHLADHEQKMSRSQFVKNTLPTIRRIADAALTPNEHEDSQRGESRGGYPWSEPAMPISTSPSFPLDTIEGRQSLDNKRPRNRMSLLVDRKDSEGLIDLASSDSCNVLVRAPFEGSMRGWEFQVEIVLKEFYNSIRQIPLPLFGATATPMNELTSLTVMTNSMLRRSPSVL